jgi:hypothetical protein
VRETFQKSVVFEAFRSTLFPVHPHRMSGGGRQSRWKLRPVPSPDKRASAATSAFPPAFRGVVGLEARFTDDLTGRKYLDSPDPITVSRNSALGRSSSETPATADPAPSGWKSCL